MPLRVGYYPQCTGKETEAEIMYLIQGQSQRWSSNLSPGPTHLGFPLIPGLLSFTSGALILKLLLIFIDKKYLLRNL